MRKLSFAIALALPLAAQACTLTLPAGLLATTAKASPQPSAPFPMDQGFKRLPDPSPRPGTESPAPPLITADLSGNPGMKAPIEGCSGEFKAADTNHNGTLDFAEWQHYRLQANWNDPRAARDQTDYKPLFAALDANQNGQLEFDEFCLPQPTPVPEPTLNPVVDCKLHFTRFDRDQNGAISWEEYDAATAGADSKDARYARFKAEDTNGDGQLSSAEFCAGSVARPLPGPSVSASLAPRDCPNFAEDDANGDGMVSWEEFYAQQVKRQQRVPVANRPADLKEAAYSLFKTMDRDGNGSLSYAEECLPPDQAKPTPTPSAATPCATDFKAFDANQDGQLSYQEYSDGRWGQLRFIKAPTPAEDASMRAGFKQTAMKLDTNGDGQLTFDEFRASCGQ